MLQPLYAGLEPIGTFDGYDGDYLTLKGGEVVTLRTVSFYAPGSGTVGDKAAYDVFDGYAPSTSAVRPCVTKTLSTGVRPLFLADEGITGYGTLFGVVVGGVAGQVVTGGSTLGPHTATASGKVTCWDKPGLYAVTLDAVDTTASTGLVPTNTTLVPGAALYATTAGLLTPASGSSFEASKVVGRFVEFTTNGSLVATPASLASALNSPVGTNSVPGQFDRAVFYWNGAF